MVAVIPFKKEHLDVMNMRAHERDIINLSVHTGAILEQSVNASTYVIDGRIICCGGANLTLYKSADIWVVPSVYVSDYSLSFLRGVKDWLETTRKEYQLQRMQTACVDDDLHEGYMSFLGFEKEGKMRQYALGKDYCMWGKLWE